MKSGWRLAKDREQQRGKEFALLLVLFKLFLLDAWKLKSKLLSQSVQIFLSKNWWLASFLLVGIFQANVN